jgi:hypothetical protein
MMYMKCGGKGSPFRVMQRSDHHHTDDCSRHHDCYEGGLAPLPLPQLSAEEHRLMCQLGVVEAIRSGVGLAAWAPDMCSPQLLRELRALQERLDVTATIHLNG